MITVTQKDNFSLPFIDQILEKLVGQSFYCFLNGYSRYNQVLVYPEDERENHLYMFLHYLRF